MERAVVVGMAVLRWGLRSKGLVRSVVVVFASWQMEMRSALAGGAAPSLGAAPSFMGRFECMVLSFRVRACVVVSRAVLLGVFMAFSVAVRGKWEGAIRMGCSRV